MDEQGVGTTKVVETNEKTDKKCRACGGIVQFEPSSGCLKCLYCDTVYDIEDTNEAPEEMDFKTEAEKANCNWGKDTIVIICKSCKAESIYDALTTAAECPYCGSKQVMEQANDNTIAPGGICPFSIDAQKAGANFKLWISRKLFAPTQAKKLAKAEVFNGAYLPFWTFDATSRSNYDAKYGIKRRVNRRGETSYETRWYNTRGSHNQSFDDKVVLGSNRYSASIMKGLEPFNTQNSKEYQPEYLSGFAAERYSIGLDEAWVKGKSYMDSDIRHEIQNKVRYMHHADTVKITSIRSLYDNITYKYLLLPVWISHFTYGGKNYQIFVNGQTGRVTGTAPISAVKVTIAVALGLAAVGILYWLTN